MRQAVALAVLLLLAGCFGGAGQDPQDPGDGGLQPGGPRGGGSGSATGSATGSSTPGPGQPRLEVAWTPLNPMPGDQVNFTAKVHDVGKRSVIGYGWDLGDNATTSTKDPTHTYHAAGNRTIVARAILSDGDILRSERTLTVGAVVAGLTGQLPGETGCSTHQSANPRPEAWYALGKPAQYYDDACFHQAMVNSPDTATLDVLIVPPPGATALRDVRLLRASVEMWASGLKAGARTHGMDWLADGLTITPFVLGVDIPAGPSAFVPDIVVVIGDQGPAGVAYAYAGIGTDAPGRFCHPVQAAGDGTLPSPEALRGLPGYDGHHGGAWGTVQLDCPTGERVCVVAGAVLYSLPNDAQAMNFYDLTSHEFGHCLGLGHVGDASDFAAKAYPPDDIMSYEQDDRDPGVGLCVSNLDLKTFAFRYRPLIAGAPELSYRADLQDRITMTGGADPIDGTAVASPLPQSSWRIFRADGSESPSVADCPQPDWSLV